MKVLKNPFFYISVFLTVVVVFQIADIVKARQFYEPTQIFPNSNVIAPIHEGSEIQTKTGAVNLPGVKIGSGVTTPVIFTKNAFLYGTTQEEVTQPVIMPRGLSNETVLFFGSGANLQIKETGVTSASALVNSTGLTITGDINITGSYKVNGVAFTGGGGSQWTNETSGIFYGGNVRVGKLNPKNTGTYPGYGNLLYFSGGPNGNVWDDSDNSDPLWLARYNVASDQSELRLNIGDDGGINDKFAVGINGSAYNLFVVQGDGKVGIGTNAPAYKLDVAGTINAGAYYLNGAPFNPTAASSPSSFRPPIARIVQGGDGSGYDNNPVNRRIDPNLNWSRVVTHESTGNGPLVRNGSVVLSGSKSVLGMSVSGRIDDGGWCAAGVKGYFFTAQSNECNIDNININNANLGSTLSGYKIISGNVAGRCSGDGAGNINSRQYIFEDVHNGYGYSGDPSVGFPDAWGYVKAVGVDFIPPGQTLYWNAFATDGPAGESIQCNIDVLYGEDISTPVLSDADFCTSNGGTAWDATNNVCKFSLSACPSGWLGTTWNSTRPTTCDGTDYDACESIVTCTTDSHPWSQSTVRESCSYSSENFNTDVSPPQCSFSNEICSAVITSVGCIKP